MTETNPEQELSIGPEHLHFVGPPMNCSGFLDLYNPSTERVRLRERLPISAPAMANAAKLLLPNVELIALLGPGGTVRTRLNLALHPQTPPGRYEAEVMVRKQARKTTIDILETWDVAVLPEAFSIKEPAGARVTRTLWITNRGNMKWQMQDALFAPLKENHGIHRNLFQSLKGAGEKGVVEVLDAFLKGMQETEVEPATVRITSSREPLEPGATREVTVEIALPKGLKRHRRYSGFLSFENSFVRLDVEVLDNPSPRSKARS
jgi:hypothetical protein